MLNKLRNTIKIKKLPSTTESDHHYEIGTLMYIIDINKIV